MLYSGRPRVRQRRAFGQRAERTPIPIPAGPSASEPSGGGKERAAVTYVISQPCIGVKDASCVEVCPVDCIHSNDDAEQYFINPQECIDCGVCAEVCPVEAIFFEDDLPEQWGMFLAKNKEFFED